MTVSATNAHIPAPPMQRHTRAAGKWIGAIFGMIVRIRRSQRTNRTRPCYQNDKAKRLKRAQRDVNRLWLRPG